MIDAGTTCIAGGNGRDSEEWEMERKRTEQHYYDITIIGDSFLA